MPTPVNYANNPCGHGQSDWHVLAYYDWLVAHGATIVIQTVAGQRRDEILLGVYR